MNLEVIYGPAQIAELPERNLHDTTAVVTDVLRATSTLVTSLAHGAKGVLPVATVEEAFAARDRVAEQYGANDVLLAGERKGVPLPGFDIGNSPGDFITARVSGKRIVQTTSNGTPALAACAGCREVIAGAFLNLSAVVAHLSKKKDGHILLVCAGTGSRFALEDALFAGAVAQGLHPVHPVAALCLVFRQSLSVALARSRNGHVLRLLGLEADIAWAAEVDRFPVLPIRNQDGWLTINLKGEIQT